MADARNDAALLRAVLDSAVDGIITIDERGRIQSANPAAERLFGYRMDEMLNRNVKMLMPSPYKDEHDGYLSNFLTTGERKIIGLGREVKGRRSDGTTFPMYLAVSQVKLDDKRLFTGIVHDLSELKQAEQAATRMGRVLEESLNEIYIFDAESLRFELVNRGARENLGYSMEQLREMTPVDVKTEYSEAQFKKLLQPLQSGEMETSHYETLHRRSDGSTYPVDVHLQLSKSHGKEVFVAIVLDVTEQKQSEAERERLIAELHQSVQQLRIRDQAIQSASEGIVIADAAREQYPIIFANAAFAAMTGYRPEDVIGRGCCLLFGDDLDQPGAAAVRQALADSTECRTVVRNYRKDGAMFWNDISIAPVRNPSGATTHVVGVMEDVTERRRNQERMVQTERLAAIGEMVTGLAHESRNALQRAQACLDMLSLDLEEQPELLDLANRTLVAIDDLRRLYEEVRNYAAPITLERRQQNLADVWRKVWSDLAVVRGDRQIELREAVVSGNLECEIDRHRMEQVFRNILENAISACPEPGRIEVESHDVESGLRMIFRDNGPGLSGDASERIFQPFFTTRQKGTGLGMAIAQRIVESHGGRIEVGRESGHGAEIVVWLPQQRPDSPENQT